MIRLFTSYFDSGNKERQDEFDKCIALNIANPFLEEIILLSEIPAPYEHKKLKTYIQNRPTYNDFFEKINERTEPDDINIISNGDIYFDRTLARLESYNMKYRCLALSRSDEVNGKFRPWHHRDSQDAWVTQGLIDVHGDFYIGRPGCDNRIAYEFTIKGYRVTNPCKSIRIVHVHETQMKSYTRAKEFIVPKPHLVVEPCYL